MKSRMVAGSGQFNIGNRVRPSGDPHMPEASGPGTVEIVDPGPAYGIRFDGNPQIVHKWYIGSELEPAGQSPAKPATTGPASSERDPKGRHVSVSHYGEVTSHATPEAAKRAQDAHHSAAMARHHKAISDVMKNGGRR